MANPSDVFVGIHDPLTGDPQERFADLTSRLDGWLSPDQTHATADCPTCGVSRCLSITYDDRGVAIWCNGRTRYNPYGCNKIEILGAVGVWLSDLKVVPPARADLYVPLGNSIPLRPELVAITGSLEGAIVLQQLLYWWPRGSLEPREGRRWIAKSHPELAAETSVSIQVLRKRVIPDLVEDGFITTRDGSFGGKRCPWYSINEATVLAAMDQALQSVR